jgi:L-fuconolactonase
MTERIDAHHHLWDPTRVDYPWLRAAPALLRRTFTADELQPQLQAAGITRTVLVQAANSREDTAFMLEQAASHDWIGAVVGWVPLDDPRAAERALDELAGEPKLRGVRDLVHSDRHPGWLDQPGVHASARLLAERGLVLDVPDAYPGHLRDVPRLAAAAPELRIVIDHLAKPPFRREPAGTWESQLRAAAASGEHVYAKLSGLGTAVGAADWTAAELRPAVDVALEAFGPERLAWGSDWPVSLLSGGYARDWQAAQELLAPLAAAERDAILGGTAAALYQLEPAVAAGDR